MKTFLFLLAFSFLFCQEMLGQSAVLRGKITNAKGESVAFVNVSAGKRGTASDSAGRFRLLLPEGESQIRFSHAEYQPIVVKITLSAGETKALNLTLNEKITQLDEVEIIDADKGDEISTLNVKPITLRNMPVPFGDFGQIMATLGLGIVSNNELSSTYTVRGGSFDENAVYVNNIEIYRPFLVRAGQQEGLSFVNPDLVKSVSFSAGGWQAKYGDKLSSVLNIEYKKPSKIAASASAGLLGATAHFEAASKNNKFSVIAGLRYKTSRYLLNTLQTKGEYFPRFVDFQTFLNWDISGKNKKTQTTQIALLWAYAQNQYEVVPQNRQSDFGTFNQTLRLFVAFEGREKLNYNTQQVGLKLSHRFSNQFTSHFIVSALQTNEREYRNLESGYRLCDVNINTASPDFNQCAFVRGVGSIFEYGRNALNASILSVESRNEYVKKKHKIEFGLRLASENIQDRLDEYNFFDSADYVKINDLLITENNLQSHRLAAYAQQSLYIGDNQTLTYGVRLNYWSLNGQWFANPRLQYSLRPKWSKDITFNVAVGMYSQPAFYREMRDFRGNVNRQLQAQNAFHFIAGSNWAFTVGKRPFRFISEIYYKTLNNVVAYDMDNVRLRYYGQNNAIAKVMGADFRISGEFIENTESWFSLSYLSAKENVNFDTLGWIRRPSDQRITATIYFEDHFPDNPSVRVNMRLIYGTGLPFGVPNEPNLRAALNGRAYNRVDIGFSKIILFKEQKKGKLESLWLGLEILNVLGINNVISYLWIPDYLNNQYAVPNGLSQRFFNLRIVARY